MFVTIMNKYFWKANYLKVWQCMNQDKTTSCKSASPTLKPLHISLSAKRCISWSYDDCFCILCDETLVQSCNAFYASKYVCILLKIIFHAFLCFLRLFQLIIGISVKQALYTAHGFLCFMMVLLLQLISTVTCTVCVFCSCTTHYKYFWTTLNLWAG